MVKSACFCDACFSHKLEVPLQHMLMLLRNKALSWIQSQTKF